MSIATRTGYLLLSTLAIACGSTAPNQTEPPRQYLCERAAEPPLLDGKLDDPAWQRAAWTADFVDIEGDARPAPHFRTRAKLLWDDEYLYVAAELEEPQLQASLTERDAVIFHDNDFEVFIDPDGDGELYYELEVNALGTVWDLLLTKTYRNHGKAIDSWDIQGLVYRYRLDGTLNDPSDQDRGWTLELALPWRALEECAAHKGPPRPGETWRLNFSRVQWRWDVEDGRYVKRVDPATGETLPEFNWVWSPQGAIDMHRPERWGYLRFSDEPVATQPAD